MTPIQAIRKKCVDCCGGQLMEIKACPVTDCDLWVFRLGINANCGNNKKNPFLQAKNFQETKNLSSSEVINKIENEMRNKRL